MMVLMPEASQPLAGGRRPRRTPGTAAQCGSFDPSGVAAALAATPLGSWNATLFPRPGVRRGRRPPANGCHPCRDERRKTLTDFTDILHTGYPRRTPRSALANTRFVLAIMIFSRPVPRPGIMP